MARFPSFFFVALFHSGNGNALINIFTTSWYICQRNYRESGIIKNSHTGTIIVFDTGSKLSICHACRYANMQRLTSNKMILWHMYWRWRVSRKKIKQLINSEQWRWRWRVDSREENIYVWLRCENNTRAFLSRWEARQFYFYLGERQ
jgi:hypothetical protein